MYNIYTVTGIGLKEVNMNKFKSLFLVGFLAIGLTGCVTNQTTGQVLGGAAGGALGSQVGGGSGRTAAIIAGTMGGAYLGGNVGQSMDDVEQLKRENAQLRAQMNRKSYQNRSYRGYPDYNQAPRAPKNFIDDEPHTEYVWVRTRSCRKVPVQGTQDLVNIKCRLPTGKYEWL